MKTYFDFQLFTHLISLDGHNVNLNNVLRIFTNKQEYTKQIKLSLMVDNKDKDFSLFHRRFFKLMLLKTYVRNQACNVERSMELNILYTIIYYYILDLFDRISLSYQ
jgi:hypothetical protein